jgi:hypothetical protein
MKQVPDYLTQFVKHHVSLGQAHKGYENHLAFIKHLALSDPQLRPKDLAELLLGVEAAARLLGLQLPEEPGDRPLQWLELNAGLTLDDLVEAAGQSTQPMMTSSDTSQTPGLQSQTPNSSTS